MSAKDFNVVFREDATATIYGRVASGGSTGSATGVPGEGNWTLRADLSSISYRVWDETNNEEVTASTAITVSDVLVDTPVTSNANWPIDSTGYNFTHSVGPASFPHGGASMAIEYTFNYAAGSIVGKAVVRGIAKPLRGS